MRPAVVTNFEAERELPFGPRIRLDVTPAQMVWLHSCVTQTARGLERCIQDEPSPVRQRMLLDGLRELIVLMRLMR